jgi:spore germination protein KC
VKYLYILTISLILFISLSGCNRNFLPTQAEIEEYDPLQVVGIDRCADDPSLVEVTFVSQTKRSSGKEGGKSIIRIMSDTGRSVFEAERKIKAGTSKRMFFGYTDYFLIGEDAAKEDFTKYFDFILRGHEIRLSPKVYIIREGTAKELLFTTSSEDRFILEKLDGFERNIDLLSSSKEVDIIEVANMLEDGSVVLPAIKCGEYKNKKIIEKQPEKNLNLSGYAFLKDNVLSGYIDKEYSCGYNLLINKVSSLLVNIIDESGKTVAMEVLEAKTKVKANFNGDKLEEVTFNTSVTTNIVEQHSLDDIFKQNVFQKLKSEVSEAIKIKMEKVIAISQEKKTDFIQLGQRLEASHPYKWRKIKNDWDKNYPELNIKVVVETHILRSYDIQKAMGAVGG